MLLIDKVKMIWSLLCLLLFCRSLSASDVLENKVHKLVTMSAQNPLINLNIDTFEEFVVKKPRNYSIVLLLTASNPQRNCQPCRYAHNQLKMLVSPWRYSSEWTNSVFFTVADFDTAGEIFSILKQNTAPAFVHISPGASVDKLRSSDYLDVHRKGLSADVIADWVHACTKVRIRYVAPPSYSVILLLTLFMIVGAVALWSGRISLDGLRNPSLWCMLSLCVIFGAISGQVYNQIRGPPLLHATPKGEIKAIIYPGSEYQFVAETGIVMLLYMACTAGIVLIHKVSDAADGSKKKVFLFTGVAMFSVAFSLLISVFRKKYQGYPYSFFFR